MWSMELARLFPAFAASQIVYWLLLFYPNTEGFSILAMLVKCLPIAVLLIYVHFRPTPNNEEKEIVSLNI
jgi:hypothetical protein